MPLLVHLQRLPRIAKALILVFVDAIFGGLTLWVAALVRSGGIPPIGWIYAVAATGFAMALVPTVGFACGLYKPVIRFHIPRLSKRVGIVGAITGSALAAVALVGGAPARQAFGLGVVFALVVFTFIVSSRHLARSLLGGTSTAEIIPVAIYGAGESGRQLLAILRQGRERTPVYFIDDDRSLQGRTVEDMMVLAPSNKHLKSKLHAKRVKEILLAIPSATMSRRREILGLLSDMSFHVRSVPSLSELVNRESHALGELKDVSIEELLGRETVAPLGGLLERCIAGKVVLVTGGGGSIGSELCRQVLALRPAQLIIFDQSEYGLYQVEQELQGAAHTGTNLRFVLGSVTDPETLRSILTSDAVNTVYHAAAYKHVPIVERNPLEGLRNNVLGTWYTARAAAQANVSHFILISSDKAVRPTNVMGATKRMSELVVQMLADRSSGTVFSMVRFGNVLGSSGSVVPLFKQQIARGGPITLTHPDVTRYFMTTQEAVQLVIQAGAMAQGGEVFVLDMGKPVAILDLAVKMIHLSGREIQGESESRSGIRIDIVGLRPGEKLYEELLITGNATETAHPRIWQARETSVEPVPYESDLRAIEQAIGSVSNDLDIYAFLTKWVIGYAKSADSSGVAKADPS